MALKMSPQNPIQFFEKVFGKDTIEYAAAQTLVDQGWSFGISLYTVAAQHIKYGSDTIGLTKGTTSLMKGTVEPEVLAQNKKLIANFLSLKAAQSGVGLPQNSTIVGTFPIPRSMTAKAQEQQVTLHNLIVPKGPKNLIVTIKVIRAITKCTLIQAKMIVDAAKYQNVVFIDNATLDFVTKATSLAAKHDVGLGWSLSGVLGDAKVMLLPELKQVAGGVLDASYIDSEPASPDSIVTDKGFVLNKKLEEAEATEMKALGNPAPHQPTISTKKPVPQAIPLRDAQVLLQRVKGTSNGSVYHTIAFSDRVKVAAKIVTDGQGKTISFRVEMKEPSNEEKMRVQQALTVNNVGGWHGEYGSLHITTGAIPLGRVVGAFLMGLGVKLDQQLTYEGDLPVDAK